MAIVRIRLALSYGEFMKYYQGRASAVQVQSIDGRRVQFPASSLRPHLTPLGIQGEFDIEFSDDTHKLVGVHRVSG